MQLQPGRVYQRKDLHAYFGGYDLRQGEPGGLGACHSREAAPSFLFAIG